MTNTSQKYPIDIQLINPLFVKNKSVERVFKVHGKKTVFQIADGIQVLMKDIKNIFSIECSVCKKRVKRVFTIGKGDGFFTRKYLCKQCSCSKERNSFWGRKHSDKSKQEISKNHANMKGKNNPFFGRRHTDRTIRQIRMKLIGRVPTDQERKNVSKGLRKFQKENKAYTRLIRSKAGYAAARSQEKYKINKPERKVQDWLDSNYPNRFEYCVILSVGQFDFGNKKSKILIEVNGDYWHCNPKIYDKPKTESQKRKMASDLKKKEFAEKHGFTLLTIWEQDINNGNFTELKEKLDEILAI